MFNNLKINKLLSIKSIYDAELTLLAEAIKSSGYYNQKAKTLKDRAINSNATKHAVSLNWLKAQKYPEGSYWRDYYLTLADKYIVYFKLGKKSK
jgi:endonuclease III-like uncharacterized protein